MPEARLPATFLCIALAWALLVVGSARAESVGSRFDAHVLKVVDGDSLELVSAGRKIKVRLWGIDAPESRQEYGRQARAILTAMVKGRRVSALGKDIDDYERLVALVWVDGELVNEKLVRLGVAWVYGRYCREDICKDWRRLEENARRDRRGLWAWPRPKPPWQARRAWTN
ncbi:MAG: thermonuclease family protein [Desulfobulbaceae bacterium]|jgi:endonuclease YncB( thermonuclease family)|nr:thermonuclease family protein [Desulfobulbaceae bacterium]